MPRSKKPATIARPGKGERPIAGIHRVDFACAQFRSGASYNEVRVALMARFEVSHTTAEHDIEHYYDLVRESLAKSLPAIAARGIATLERAIAIAEADRKPADMIRGVQQLLEAAGVAEARKIELEVKNMERLTTDQLEHLVALLEAKSGPA